MDSYSARLHTEITGNRSQSRRRKRWIDITKEELADKGSCLSVAQIRLYGRQVWRSSIQHIAGGFPAEDGRKEENEDSASRIRKVMDTPKFKLFICCLYQTIIHLQNTL